MLPSDFLETDDITEELMSEWSKKAAVGLIELVKRHEAVEAEEYSLTEGYYSEAHLKKLNMVERQMMATMVCLM